MDQVSITGIRVSYLTLHRHSWRGGVRRKDREEGMKRARERERQRQREGRREREERERDE